MPTAPPPIKRLLLIIDDEDDVAFFRECLQYVDPSIELYFLPQCNLAPLREAGFLPDLIFLDVRLPRRDGLAFLGELRQSAYRRVPVIMYATVADHPYVEKAYRCGASLYTIKPVSFKGIMHLLETVLKKTDWRDPATVARSYCVNGKYQALEVE